jgi:hypothetical protein
MLAVVDMQKNQLTLYSGRYVRYALDLCGAQLISFTGVPINHSVDVESAVRRTDTKNGRRVRVCLPRLVTYGTRTQLASLKDVRTAVESEVLQVGLNNYSSAVKQYLYRFPKPRAATRVLAGPGSNRVFRRVMADRMTEYAMNLWWLRSERGDAVQDETDAFFAALRELKPYLPQSPHMNRVLALLKHS